MRQLNDAVTGQFCWLDLAASDADRARRFYGRMFGWEASDHLANGGRIVRLHQAGHDMGSLYQLSRAHLQAGVPSHWTPYVRVRGIHAAVERAVACGARLVVEPFAVTGLARVALIQDTVGALVGLWESLEAVTEEHADGQAKSI